MHNVPQHLLRAADINEFGHDCDTETIVLWRLQGARHELVCTTIVTSFGFALHLAMAGEPILLELQRTVEHLTEKAARLESWLIEQGWTPVPNE